MNENRANIVNWYGQWFYVYNADKFDGLLTIPVRGQGNVTAERVRITETNAKYYGKSESAARSQARRHDGYSKASRFVRTV